MKFSKFILILPFLCWGFNLQAQMPSESSSMPEQWQLTLDVIKSKAQTLVVENNGLQNEYRQLVSEVQKLQQSISNQESKNAELRDFLKERHGRTDQQLRIEELTEGIKTKKQHLHDIEGQLKDLNLRQAELDRKIQLLHVTISDAEIREQEAKEQVQILKRMGKQEPSSDFQLDQLRKQLEDENKQEVILSDNLQSLKSGKSQALNAAKLNAENKKLEAHLDSLRLQKAEREKEIADAQLAQANARKFEQLKKRKNQLENAIRDYEARLDNLRETSLLALSWPLKKKKLVHEMVQADAFNNQMRTKIKVLNEDIDVLREQVGKLERQVNFIQGNTKQ